MVKSPRNFTMLFTKRVFDLDWRFFALIITILPLSLFLFYSFNSNAFPSFYPVQNILHNLPFGGGVRKDELLRSRMAVCLVGGARRFELTGPSLTEMVLNEYPNSDLFLHSPLDHDTFKFSVLKSASNNVAAVRIFRPQPLPENESYVRVLTAQNSPNGIQGLIQYFNLVEGCLSMIKSHQEKNNFTYDWIIRTRVDGYWNAPLGPDNFIPGQYLVPSGSSYGGLNDRLGIGDLTTSTVALSRLSLIPALDSAHFTELNSESAFKAQLTTQNVTYLTNRLPFCIVSDRSYDFPPGQYGVPVASLSSPGPLSGAKCRPCRAVCEGACVEEVMVTVEREWSWTDWTGGALALCDARESWENRWEKVFDKIAGKKFAAVRKRVHDLKFDECVNDFNEFKKRAAYWDAPSVEEICTLGLKRT